MGKVRRKQDTLKMKGSVACLSKLASRRTPFSRKKNPNPIECLKLCYESHLQKVHKSNFIYSKNEFL